MRSLAQGQRQWWSPSFNEVVAGPWLRLCRGMEAAPQFSATASEHGSRRVKYGIADTQAPLRHGHLALCQTDIETGERRIFHIHSIKQEKVHGGIVVAG